MANATYWQVIDLILAASSRKICHLCCGDLIEPSVILGKML
jgi:hypothetical protein